MDGPQNAFHLNFRKGAPELLEAHEQEVSWGERKRIGKTIFCTPFPPQLLFLDAFGLPFCSSTAPECQQKSHGTSQGSHSNRTRAKGSPSLPGCIRQSAARTCREVILLLCSAPLRHTWCAGSSVDSSVHESHGRSPARN